MAVLLPVGLLVTSFQRAHGGGQYQYRCDKPHNGAEEELCVERDAANAAEDNASAAILTLYVGVGGLAALIGTLVFTGIAAQAGRDVAKTASKSLADLERPWLYLESAGFKRRDFTGTDWDKTTRITPYAYWIDITFRNSGRMLAEVVEVQFMVTEKSELGQEPDYSGNLFPLNFERKFILPGKTGKSGQFGVPIPTFDPDPAYSPPQLVIYGRLKYKGLTSIDHETGFTIEPWFIGGAWMTYGGEAYNYHR